MENKKKQKHGLQVPPSYFDTLEEAIFIRIAEENLPKETGFKIPPTYFNSLEGELNSKISLKKETRIISLFSRKHLRYVASIAAVFLVAFVLIFNQKNIDLETIQTSEIEAYVTSEKFDLSTQDIAQLLTDDDLEALELQAVSFSEENLESYLLETINDASLLTE